MKLFKILPLKILPIILVLFCFQFGFSQEEAKPEQTEAEKLKASQKKDNTGTNPVNFTYDFRLVQEMQQLKNSSGSQSKTYVEFRAPMGRDIANVLGENAGANLIDLGSRWAVRLRGYYNNVTLNDNSAAGSTTYSGIGDFDARVLHVLTANSKIAVAPGLEVFFNTATNDVVGSGSTILAPVVFVGMFNWLGKNSIVAPGIQHQFSVSGKDVSRTVLDLYFVYMLAKGKNWLIVNPQPIYDWENETEFAQVDFEWGFMIAKASGVAGYVRPGLGIGADRPFDYNFEFGIKFIWR